MKTLRSTFEENYRAVPEPCDNKRGFKMRYVYIGLWYIWNLPPERVRTAKRLIGTACLFSALLFFSGAFLNSPLNHDRYVSLTGMLSIAALVFEVFGTVQFCAAREKMTSMDFHDIQTKLMLAPRPTEFCCLSQLCWRFGRCFAGTASVWQTLWFPCATRCPACYPC